MKIFIFVLNYLIMNRNIRTVSTVAALLISATCLARTMSFGNADFKASVSLRHHRLVDITLTDTRTGAVSSSDAPVFEFCIDGRTVSSSDPVWNWAGETVRHLSNGGTVVTWHLRGGKFLKGLDLWWDREYFQSGTMLRERLRLSSKSGHRLTDVDGANHFIFPQYTFDGVSDASAHELRMATFRTPRKFPTHHMNHPVRMDYDVSDETVSVKGPFLTVDCGRFKVLNTYEHASQDTTFMKPPVRDDLSGNDEGQLTEGDLDYISNDDLWFIAAETALSDGRLTVRDRIRHGGYLDGETIPESGCYETVWSTTTLLRADDDVNAVIGDYLYSKITDHAASRVAGFYYNTWGMQRASKDLYSVMNEERLLQEIDAAAELGVETFVIDDGWHVTFGDWRANRERLPHGLKPLVDRMHSYGIRPGIWVSTCGAGKATQRTLDHPDWIIRDGSGEPVKGQWKNPVYDIVGPCYDLILADLKALTDEGIRFFKWDGVNMFNSSIAGLYHGDESRSRREIIDRYNYLFPFYITSLMRELREYCPDAVIEMDLTESDRNIVGLMPLQESKFYFINNGASGYNDYTTRRSRSVRSVINEYADFVPQEIFTYAYYPIDEDGSMIYNVTSSLSAGHGFWGDLQMTTPEQRASVRELVMSAREILPHVAGCLVERTGAIDASPEIYVQRSADSGYALVTVFSREPLDTVIHVDLPVEKIVGTKGCTIDGTGISIPVHFDGRDGCCAAFVTGKE